VELSWVVRDTEQQSEAVCVHTGSAGSSCPVVVFIPLASGLARAPMMADQTSPSIPSKVFRVLQIGSLKSGIPDFAV